MTISTANIEFNQEGTPVASQFDDVYFSNANGLQESNYVFLQNNQLPERWSNWTKRSFVIAETGFGTGLNFLVAWLAFRQFRQRHPDSPLRQLFFISTEKFLIRLADLRQALSKWPELASLSEQLFDQYPLSIPGCHRLKFDQEAVTLDLWLGDVNEQLPHLNCGQDGLVDCWFLDGFAPSKNPDMWSTTLYQQMARLARKNATFATFTAAGQVKRGLREVGFVVEKRKGFGRKRDMLAGHLDAAPADRVNDKVHFRHAMKPIQSNTKVAIVGAGLAGANLTYALTRKGIRVTVYEQASQVAHGASGNPQGGFYPQLNAEFTLASQIQACAFTYASRQYQQLLRLGFDFAHQWCGVLQLAFNENVAARQQKLVDNQCWPAALVEQVSSQQSSKVAKIPLPYAALHIPLGGWINPPALINALLNAAKQSGLCDIRTDARIERLSYQDNWQLQFTNGLVSAHPTVVLTTGAQTGDFEAMSALPLRLVRGQVEAVPTQAPLQDLSTVLCHKGYITPEFEGHHALGSTYVKNDVNTDYRASEQQQNIDMNVKALSQCTWPDKLELKSNGRAAIRCSSPDHLPLVGAIPDYAKQRHLYQDLYKALPRNRYPFAQDLNNLFVLTGLGSRGLTTAPLMAEILACQMTGQPLPLPDKLLTALNPNRFLIKDLIRRSDSSQVAGSEFVNNEVRDS